MPFNYLRKLTGHERTQNGGVIGVLEFRHVGFLFMSPWR